jgi:hypothetical protein
MACVRQAIANDRLVVMRSLPVGHPARARHGLKIGRQLQHLAQAGQGFQAGIAQAHPARRAAAAARPATAAGLSGQYSVPIDHAPDGAPDEFMNWALSWP